MSKDLLDLTAIEQELQRTQTLKKWIRNLLYVNLIVIGAFIVICFRVIPSGSTLSEPGLFRRMNVATFFSMIAAVIVPAGVFVVSLALAAIPFNKAVYKHRLLLVFGVLLLLIELYLTYQMVTETWDSI